MSHWHDCPDCKLFYPCNRDGCTGKPTFACIHCCKSFLAYKRLQRHLEEAASEISVAIAIRTDAGMNGFWDLELVLAEVKQLARRIRRMRNLVISCAVSGEERSGS